MTDKQSNYLDMFLVVKSFHDDNDTIIDAVPARATAFGLHATRITAINALASAQTGNITGVAADKAALRSTLDTLAFDHMTAALAWARTQSNNTLAAEFDYTQSDIEKVKDDTVIAFCQHRHQLITANIAALADYGLLPTTLDAWQTAMDAYGPLVAGPRSARVSKKVITAQLKTLFKQTNDHLRDIIDPLMLALRASQPDIYLGYQSSRIIIDRKGQSPTENPNPSEPEPTTTVTISGNVSSSVTGSPLPNALLRAYDPASGPDPDTIEVFTGPDGNYIMEIDGLTEQTDIIIEASEPTHITQGRNLTIEPGEEYIEDFQLPQGP